MEGCLCWQKTRLRGYSPRYFGFPRLLHLFLSWFLTIFQNQLVFPFSFHGLHLLQWANFLKQEADHLRAEAHWFEAKGLQQKECVVTGLQAEGLYDLLKVAVAQPELPVSGGPPLSKRKWVATATISSPTAQESEAITPKCKEGVSGQGALICPFLNPKRKWYQLRWSL